MKNDLKNQKKPFRISSETVRQLSLAQLTDVVGGITATTSRLQSHCNIGCNE